MAKRERRWDRVRALADEEKASVAAACDNFIAQVLKPRFLLEIRPMEFDYPVDLSEKWWGSRYSFVTRYRSGFAENREQEFNAPFVRLDHDDECLDGIRFDVMWHRHTGEWRRLYSAVTLEEALSLIETDPLLQPIS